MNRLPAPVVDDAAAFLALAANARVGSYPHLQEISDLIQECYAQYEAVSGNPFAVPNPVIAEQLAEYLRGHYKSPPKDISHVDDLRRESAHMVCPMCGSMHSGTLDHYLPKQDYPAYAIFSKNLVPACKCNVDRGESLLGANAGERVLHPYFDACLGERLIRANFDSLGSVPEISIAITVSSTHANYSAVAFHVATIVCKTSVLGYLRMLWAKFVRKPPLVISSLGRAITSQADLVDILQREQLRLDDLHGSRNNWNSMFVSGLLEQPVAQWLFSRLSVPGRSPNDALE